MFCPRDLREGDYEEYLKEFIEMLEAYFAGNYVDVTDVEL